MTNWAESKRKAVWMSLCSCDAQTLFPVWCSSTSSSLSHVIKISTLTGMSRRAGLFSVGECRCFCFFVVVVCKRTIQEDVKSSLGRWLSRFEFGVTLMTRTDEVQTLLFDRQTWDLAVVNTVI